MVAVETLADWSMARSVIFLVAKLLGFLAAGSDTPMKDTGFARYYVERLDKTLWCIPFAFNPFFSSGKRGCRLLTDKLTDYRSYQQLMVLLPLLIRKQLVYTYLLNIPLSSQKTR